MESPYSPQSRAERLIAAGRVVLAASSLLAVWLDPSEPTSHVSVAYALLGAYVVYAVCIALLVWRTDIPLRRLWGIVSHALDLAFFTLFIYFTAGPASPFTTYFVFALVCATLRWQWRGALWTAVVSLAAFLGLGLYFALVLDDPLFQLYPLIVRGVYLAVIAVLLGYLGAHEERTGREMSLLAAWPQDEPRQAETLVSVLLEHASRALGAPRALLAWMEREEPWLYLASWEAWEDASRGGELTWNRAAPELFGGLVATDLADSSFLCLDAASAQPMVLRRGPRGLQRWRGIPLDPALRERFALRAVLSLPLQPESM